MLTQHCKIEHLNILHWRRLSELVFGNRFPNGFSCCMKTASQ